MDNTPKLADRIVSGLTYLSAGIVGVMWLIISAVRGKFPPRFTLYHIMQSVFLSLLYVIFNFIFWHIVGFLSYIPLLNRLIRQLVYLFNMPFIIGYSIMQCLIYGTILYLAVFAFMGLYSYIPWVSDIIKSNFRK